MPRVILVRPVSFSRSRIPVSLHSASREPWLDFSLLDRRDRAPIEYSRSQNTGKPVEWGDIVEGCQVEANRAERAVSSCGRGRSSSSARLRRA